MTNPNLLFIYTDEQASNTLEAYGNSRIDMPNLNRLARRATVFDRAYVTQPVCTPSRSTLLTGLYPHTNGCTANNIPLKSDTRCLPELISRGEYAAGHFGKWHLGDELFAQHGFKEWVSVEDFYNEWFSEGRDRNERSDYHHFLVANGFSPKNGETFGRGEAARLPEQYGKPAFLAREASRFLRENRDNPFMLFVNFLEPHMPYYDPRDDQYDPRQIPLPPNFDAEAGDNQHLKSRILAEAYREWGHEGQFFRTREDWQQLIARYWGLCSLVDTHVGVILDTLDECGLDDNTIVVFTSDHGDMMGSHRLLAKCVMYEEAVRVPLIMKLPGQTHGKRVTGPVSQVDVVPTLLELMNQPLPGHLQGESLCGCLADANPVSKGNVFIEWNGANTGRVGESKGECRIPSSLKEIVSCDDAESAVNDPIRTVITPDGWKLNHSERGEHELYNLVADPGEITNLYGRNEHAARTSELRNHIRAWQQRTGDSVPIS